MIDRVMIETPNRRRDVKNNSVKKETRPDGRSHQTGHLSKNTN